MWTCPNCNRIFERNEQPHSCKTISLEQHFRHKELAKEIFDYLLDTIRDKVGEVEVISLPCCIHLFGHYDFLAALPKKDRLEIRLGLDRVLRGSRVGQSVPLSHASYKNCIDLLAVTDIDDELIDWIKESYYLKGGKS